MNAETVLDNVLDLNLEGDNSLGAEIRYFERNHHNFAQKYNDRFVVIKGQRVLGDFNTNSEALRFGYNKFGTDVSFLVKKVVAHNKPSTFLMLCRVEPVEKGA